MKPKPKEGVSFVRRENYSTEMSDGSTMEGLGEIKDSGSYTTRIREREKERGKKRNELVYNEGGVIVQGRNEGKVVLQCERE